jgi:hypothetical protein
MSPIRDRLTYVNVMVTLVALVVLGAVAYALLELLPSDSGGPSTTVTGSVPRVQPPEPWHLVGAINQPPFTTSSSHPGCTWRNRIPGQRSAAAFYRGSNGVVHLRGELVAGGTCDPATAVPPIFSLPLGYRPVHAELQPTGRRGYPGFPITIAASGSVGPRSYFPLRRQPIPISLYGITFRCGPSGLNGCP